MARTPEEPIVRVSTKPQLESNRRKVSEAEASYLAAVTARLDSIEYGDPSEFVLGRTGRDTQRRSALSEVWVPPTLRTPDERSIERDVNALWSTSEQCAVVIADPGHGKSTLARFLTCKFAQEFLANNLDRFAFYVPLAGLRLKTRTNQRAIIECALRAVDIEPDAATVVQLEQSLKTASIIFDGLDELPTSQANDDLIPTRIEAAALIRSVNIRNNESFRTGPLSTVVTCRILDWFEDERTKIKPAALFELSNFSPQQAKDAVSRWHDAARRMVEEAGVDAGDLARRKDDITTAISTNPELGAVCLTPLMLSILQTVYSDDSGDIPSSVSQLCLRAVERLLIKKHSIGEQGNLVNNYSGWILDALARAAFISQERFVAGRSKVLTDEDLRLVAKETCPLPDSTRYESRENLITSIVGHIRRGHGILHHLRRNEYDFAHSVFREVLAGHALAKLPVTQRREYALDEKWHPPIRYWAGLRAASEDGKHEINGFVGELRGGAGSRAIEAILARAEMLSEVVSVTRGRNLMRDLKQRIESSQSELLKSLGKKSLPFAKRLRVGDLLGTLGDPRLDQDFMKRLLWIEGGIKQIGRVANHSTRITKYPNVPASPRIEGELSRYALSTFLVTNLEFKKFLDSGGYGLREFWQSDYGWAWACGDHEILSELVRSAREVAPTHLTSEVLGRRLIADDFPDQCEKMIRRSAPMYWTDPAHNRSNQPVVGVNWWEALAYASWLSKTLHSEGKLARNLQVRLPTEAEWEVAARQCADGNMYPWKDGAPSENAHLRATEVDELRASRSCGVGLFLFNSTDLYDLVGNVWEWTLSVAKPYASDSFSQSVNVSGLEDRIARGSSWLSSETEAAEITFRSFDPPYNAYEDLGIRLCVAEQTVH